MAREDFQRSLDDLRTDVVALGDLVLERLESALRALAEGDAERGERVVAGDETVNDQFLALEGDCIDLFALQQPVASDLRFVAASFKVLTDLERVGDLAANVGGYAAAGADGGIAEVDVLGIGSAVHEQLSAALAAYEDGDPVACREVVADDDRVDAMCARASERVVRALVEEGDAWDVERAVDDASRGLLVVRDLERVGDHAVNVAARTLYAVESDPELVR